MPDKIMYISPVWTNLGGYKLADVSESGMPAFSEPLKKLVTDGYKVNLLWLEDSSSPLLIDPFLKSQPRIALGELTKFRLIFSLFKILIMSIWHIVKCKPDVVFCHGTLSVGGILASILMRKRTVVRVYGTNKYSSELVRLGKWRFLLNYPFVFLMFFISSEALIATDDGSNADIIFKNIGRARNFYFLKNGFPIKQEITVESEYILLCVGRITKKKNQIAALKFFEEVARVNDTVLLKFIGVVSDYEYFVELKDRIKSSEYSKRVEVLGGMSKIMLHEYYLKADALLSFQYNSNFGNTTIECLTHGCLLITHSEESFVRLSTDPVALYGDLVEELAVKYLSLNTEEKRRIRENGQRSITRELDSWAERATVEVGIVIENYYV
jgi:glycosyltransferase involved in cell wall biosynthesis